MSGPGDGTEQEATAPAEASSPPAWPDDGAAAQVEAEAPAGAESPGDGAAGDGGEESDDAPDPADAGARGDAADSDPDPEADLRERAGKADGYLDLARRTQADFDNYRLLGQRVQHPSPRGGRIDGTAATWTTVHHRWSGTVDLGDRAAQVTQRDYLGAIGALLVRRATLEHTIDELIPGSPWPVDRWLRCLRGIDTLSLSGCAPRSAPGSASPRPHTMSYLGLVPVGGQQRCRSPTRAAEPQFEPPARLNHDRWVWPSRRRPPSTPGA